MLSKDNFMKILSKYPELVEPGLVLKGCQINLYGQEVDMLFEDQFKKRVVVQVKTSPIEEEHVGEMVSYQNVILSGEAPDISVMLVADKVPAHLQKTFEHNGITWKEISMFQIREHLISRNDGEMLGLLAG